MIQLRVTTCDPQSMAGVSEPLVIPEDIGQTIETELKGDRAYLHGDLETKAGYDIPIFMDGDLGQLDLPIREQDILVMLPTGEYQCIARLQNKNQGWGDYNAYYITLKS